MRGPPVRIVHFNQADPNVPSDLVNALRDFPNVELTATGNPDELISMLVGAEILIINNRSYSPGNSKIIRDNGQSLRWIQFSTSGVDNGVKNGLPSGVIVTNVGSLRAFSVAEQAFTLMLALVRQVRALEKARDRRDWCRDSITPTMDNLAGKHLVIIGMGAVGQDIARKAKAFDMNVTGVTRSIGRIPYVDHIRPRGELSAACAEADIVVIAASHDSTSDQILARGLIEAMKSTAYVVNVARGQLIDEPALIDALQAKKIAGAGLDVTFDEPTPKEHPFWEMPNVVLSPHIGGAGTAGTGGLGAIFADNLQLWLRGAALNKVVIPRTP
jgi:phosphoglycerate dehydrogenase-like enzyme